MKQRETNKIGALLLEEVSPRNEAGSRTLNLLDYLTSKCHVGTRTKQTNCHTGGNTCVPLGSQIQGVYPADRVDAGLLGCTW